MIMKVRKPLQYVAVLGLVATGALYSQDAKSVGAYCKCEFNGPMGNFEVPEYLDPCNTVTCKDVCDAIKLPEDYKYVGASCGAPVAKTSKSKSGAK